MRGSSRRVKASLFTLDISFINLGIGISQLDSNVTFELILETNRLDSTNRLDYRGLAVGDVSDGTNINGSLTRNLQYINIGIQDKNINLCVREIE